jgi:hypothetical protein
MTTMLEQFRLNYPQGSIISDLIAIDHGKYIVKVTLKVDNQIIATALAGAETVEIAEECARERALKTLLFYQQQPENLSKKPVKDFQPLPNPKLNLAPVSTVDSPDPISKPEISNSSETKLDNLVSDIIAEINLHMERLAWTKEQGKDYLLRTYGKKSRHLLSDAELLEFLSYLKSQ